MQIIQFVAGAALIFVVVFAFTAFNGVRVPYRIAAWVSLVLTAILVLIGVWGEIWRQYAWSTFFGLLAILGIAVGIRIAWLRKKQGSPNCDRRGDSAP